MITAVIILLIAAASVFARGEAESTDPETLRVAVILDESNPKSGELNDAFIVDMADTLGMPVEGNVIMEYGVGIEAMRSGKLDAMLVSPMSYYQAKQRTNVEPLVTTEVSLGGVDYRTYFITRSDRDDINTLEDLEGKSFAFVDPGSSSGYVYPKLLLVQELGLDPLMVENPDYFFGTSAYSGRHDASLMGVLMGDYDAAVVAAPVVPMMVATGAISEGDIKVIAQTPKIPNPLYIIRADISTELKSLVKDFFLSYDNPEYFESLYQSPEARYIAVNEEDYKVIEDIVKILGIEEE